MKSRVILLFLAFTGAFAAIVVRLFYLQCLPNEALDRLRKNQYTTVVQLPSQRGKILDRRGEELATSVTTQSLYADPSLIKTPRRLSKKLASVLGMDAREIYAALKSQRRFVWIKRRLDPDVATEIKEWSEQGLKFVEEGRRAYPNQNLMSQVLGFVGTDGEGLEGLEKKYDAELKGEKQAVVSRRDARGRPLVVSGQIFELHADGATIETTIDKELQYSLEHELEEVTLNQRADKASGVIMDPATGEILAMASYPSFDPSAASRANPDNRRDRVISDIYEPGSTFKIVAAAAALKTGRIKPNTKYFCENGKFKIGKYYIHEAEASHDFGWLTLAEILAVSSNIGSTKVAFDVGQDGIKQMIHDFGFGAPTGVDLSGEARGIITPGNWPEHLFSNVSFGHGIGVTALQMANAYSAIANGGKLLKPYLVKRIVDADGRVLEEHGTQVVRQVLSTKDASTMTLMLSEVTQQGGTGILARVDGYPVAGKTGTAQKVNPAGRGYMKGAYISSFVGFVPANNPQYTIYVMVDNPKKQFYGAQVAAPIFNHLASFALHQRGFMPIVVTENGKAQSGSAVKDGKSVAATKATSNASANTNANSTDPTIVPDFTGMTIRDVSKLLKDYEKNSPDTLPDQIELIGNGIARSQSPSAGQRWTKSEKVKITFRPAGG